MDTAFLVYCLAYMAFCFLGFYSSPSVFYPQKHRGSSFSAWLFDVPYLLQELACTRSLYLSSWKCILTYSLMVTYTTAACPPPPFLSSSYLHLYQGTTTLIYYTGVHAHVLCSLCLSSNIIRTGKSFGNIWSVCWVGKNCKWWLVWNFS